MSGETGTKPSERIKAALGSAVPEVALVGVYRELDAEAERRSAWEAKVAAEFRKLGVEL